MIMSFVFLNLFALAAGYVIPFEYEAGRPYVHGTYENISTISNISVRMFLHFDTRSWAELDWDPFGGFDADSGVNFATIGSVNLRDIHDNLRYAFTDRQFGIHNFLPGNSLSKGYMGLGPSSAFLNESRGSLSFVVHSPDRGLLLVGYPEDRFTSLCSNNTLFTTPFLPPQPGPMRSRKLQGRLVLLDSSTGARIEYPGNSRISHSHIQIVPERMLISRPMYRVIRDMVPELSNDNFFDNCEYIRSILPVISIELQTNDSQVAGTILFYPTDYALKQNEQSDVCVLQVGPSVIDGYVAFDPLLLPETNIRITDTNISFCDSLYH